MEDSARHRFGKNRRLPDAAAFGRVFENASRSRDTWFTVLCRNNDLEHARLGLAISKKQCKKAAARNRLKRIVRESFRQHQAALEGLDVVVMNRARAADAESGVLRESLDGHWQRCRELKTGNSE